MLEIIGGKPRTYKVSSVDAMTERYYEDGVIRGFLVLNVVQDLYDPKTDNADLMICDYVSVANDDDGIEWPVSSKIEIVFSGAATIRQGGSFKRFSALLYRKDALVESAVFSWTVDIPDEIRGMIEYQENGTEIRIRALDFVETQGKIIRLTASAGETEESIDVEVVA